MQLGLKRGTVELVEHDDEWKTAANKTITILKFMFGYTAVDIQHIGSTAIEGIKAKPIIDLVVGVRDMEQVKELIPQLEENDFIYRNSDVQDQLLFICGDFKADTRTNHIHVVLYGGPAWTHYINFRDYLNTFPTKAKEYESLKLFLADKYKDDRVAYTNGKQDLIDCLLAEAADWRASL